MKRNKLFLSFFLLGGMLFAQNISSISEIDWTTKTFTSNITMDTVREGIKMPSGKKTASMKIKTKTPELIQRPLLTLFVNNRDTLGDEVVKNAVTLDQIAEIIEDGETTPEVFSHDTKSLKTTNKLNVDSISSKLIRHKSGYTPEEPIESVPSRAYSGIVIDARGAKPVHGEYVQSEIYPSFFPMVWDEEMNVIFEKNMVEPSVALKRGTITYHYSDDYTNYEEIVGYDAMYIRAVEVYGRNRTDPVLKKSDALKILTVPENVELLNQGKVVILLDKKNLIYKVTTPDKDPEYYVKFNTVKQYMYKNKVDDIIVSDGRTGLVFTVDLKFYPDSDELLPGEKARVRKIADMLKEIITDDSYTILVEGHTADVGKPVGQLNLSIERTRTVMNGLIDEGLRKDLFSYQGWGGLRPVDTNATEEGRAKNRRVEITARPRATYIQRDW